MKKGRTFYLCKKCNKKFLQRKKLFEHKDKIHPESPTVFLNKEDSKTSNVFLYILQHPGNNNYELRKMHFGFHHRLEAYTFQLERKKLIRVEHNREKRKDGYYPNIELLLNHFIDAHHHNDNQDKIKKFYKIISDHSTNIFTEKVFNKLNIDEPTTLRKIDKLLEIFYTGIFMEGYVFSSVEPNSAGIAKLDEVLEKVGIDNFKESVLNNYFTGANKGIKFELARRELEIKLLEYINGLISEKDFDKVHDVSELIEESNIFGLMSYPPQETMDFCLKTFPEWKQNLEPEEIIKELKKLVK